MSYETLMVQLELGRSNAGPLGVARDLAKRMGAAVSGVAAAQPLQIAMAAEGYYGGDLVIEDTKLIEAEAKKAEQEFQAAMTGCAAHPDWMVAVTRFPLAERIAEATGNADLLVVGVAENGKDNAGSMRTVDIGDLVMRAGRPVLAVPLSVKHFEFRCALVAWKDSREARRALTDALPLLQLMDRVVLVEVTAASEQGPVQTGLAKMVSWLARHGVEASSRLITALGTDGDRLLSIAEEEEADLIVAGAYGHSRFREWVLGGVTRSLLRGGKRCLLLSH
jgi:nucleotide-binding universal stress UspA family protein